MYATECSYTIRYNPKNNERIAWAGDGIYKWDCELELWVKVSEAEWDYYGGNENARLHGTFLAFTEETTLDSRREK